MGRLPILVIDGDNVCMRGEDDAAFNIRPDGRVEVGLLAASLITFVAIMPLRVKVVLNKVNQIKIRAARHCRVRLTVPAFPLVCSAFES